MSKNAKFFVAAKPFFVQAIAGCLMAVYRVKPEWLAERDEKRLNYYLARYLNDCYHDYHKRTDQFVVSSMNEIFAVDVIRGTVCLLNWLLRFGAAVFSRLSQHELAAISVIKDVQLARKRLIELVVKMYDQIVKDFENVPEFSCSGNCCDEYNGKDLFSFSE